MTGLPIYPGFTAPDDLWPIVENRATERDELRARQVVDDAEGSHLLDRHEAHHHPWCPDCEYRKRRGHLDAAGRSCVRRPEEIPSDLDDAEADRLIDAYHELMDTLRVSCRDRALRFLLLHGKPPVDTYAPDAAGDLDALYLRRDQLDGLPEAEPLIEHVLPRHSYAVLRGRDQSYKSFVALDWSLCLATGRPWLGHRSEQVPVLYIAGEGAYGVEARVAAWEAHHNVAVDSEAFVVRTAALNMHRTGQAFEHLLDHIGTGGYGLVVVDTLRRVSGAADGNGSEMGAVVDNLDRIKRATADGTVLTVAHTDKSDTDSRGYSGIEDDADVVWHAKRDEDTLRLRHTKMKDGPELAEIILRPLPVRHSLVLEPALLLPPSATESQLKVLDALRYSTDEGATSAALMKLSDLPRSTFYLALHELREAGHIVNTGTKARPFYELVQPDTESNESSPVQDPNPRSQSNQSNAVQGTRRESSPVQQPLRAGLGLGTDLEPEGMIYASR